MQNRLDNIYIVLVEPIYGGNVGAVARVMNNFGLSKLRIVGELPSKNDYYLAVHSEEILDNVACFGSLAEALGDIDRVIAFSRRVGKTKPVDMGPPEAGKYIAGIPHLKTAVVFGRETYGLTDEEADLCPMRCHIPANPAFPSFNLAQAVAIAAWEIYSNPPLDTSTEDSEDVASDGLELDKIKAYMLDVMQEIGFFKSHESTNWEAFLSRMLSRLNPTKEMLYRFRQMFNRFHVLVKGKGKGYD